MRVRFRAIALLTAAVSLFAISAAVANIISGFLGGWLVDVALIAIGIGGLRGAWLVWEIRERVASGHDRLARADEATRQATHRRGRRGGLLVSSPSD